jgi:hypothetical protein
MHVGHDFNHHHAQADAEAAERAVRKRIQTMNAMTEETSTFQSIFFAGDNAMPVRVPDYQRAYSWEQKQIELFLADLVKYHGVGKGYYFGHFIAEDIGEHWEIVDGQQRITTFVLFLMVCRVLLPSGAHASAFSMIQQFSTVSYDVAALGTIGRNLGAFLEANGHFDERKPPSDERIIADLSLEGTFTRSQRRMVLALLRFHQAFQKGELERDKIGGYIAAVMTAHCSHHLTQDKSVAVNIFEMQNTRGIPLTTLEIIKAMLMKFVYDHGGEDRRSKVGQIQSEFGEIYGMEERVAARSFRGEMTMEQLLRLHLRVVDDGTKKTANDFHSPATNANSDALVEYVDSRLHYENGDKTKPKDSEDGVQYALNLAKEFKKSVRIVSETLPAWDEEDSLVGDVLILDRDLSCQFFLIVCRCLERGQDKADGRIGSDSLLLWEKLLFTRDFHGEYYNLKGGRDNFPALFASCRPSEERIAEEIKGYLADGFRPDRTKGLPSIVVKFLNEHQESILNQAFYWWKSKMIYAIYKYEISKGAKIREVMKGTISVEHILPQEWLWIKDKDEDLNGKSGDEWDSFRKEIEGCINGIGNLLLITPGENTSVGNQHPADKEYEKYCAGGSYKEHDQSREKWRRTKEWSHLIRVRGEEIFKFMLGTLIDGPKDP